MDVRMAVSLKKKGETSTTVSVGIRIDPKIKFALDMMGREQKRSLTAVIEWAISRAIAEQPWDIEGSFAQTIDKVWSTDESTRFANLGFEMPQVLTYDELRIWETIKASPYFWHKHADGTYSVLDFMLDKDLLRNNWADLLEHVQSHRSSPTVVPFDPFNVEPPF